ncbi:MAG TPA: site-specific integrase, partial [Saprospiraceae bacterium]|nr:site-specific integrase [Saprospiraceae bacterium]HMQ85562.1 site-specific integrase [Saprospiraceae bacterium]
MHLQIFPLFYKDEGKKIGILPYPDTSTKEKLKHCGILRYSKTYKTWYLPYERKVFEQLKYHFPDLQILVSNAQIRTESALEQKIHQTDIASDSVNGHLPKHPEPLQNLRIVACENKGWLVQCDFGVGQKLKAGLDKCFWLKKHKSWYVPARKGNFAKLQQITGVEVPFLVFEKNDVPQKVQIKAHPENKEYVLVELPYNATAYEIIKTTKTRYYDKGRKCWRILNQNSIREGLVERLKAAKIEVEILPEVLESVVKEGKLLEVRQNREWVLDLPKDLRALFTEYTDALMLRKYSWQTIKSYRSAFKEYCQNFNYRCPDQIQAGEAQKWLTEKVKEGWSESSMVTMICALRYYYVQIRQRKDWEFYLPFPRREEKLPNVLSQEEVKAIFNAVNNLKHKTMLLLGYAAGLRVSEVVNLRLKDLDSQRMVIHIKAAKGKKDRCVMLSEVLLETLRLYYKTYKPKEWLFEGQNYGCYSTRSVQKIFQTAKQQVGIKKEV